MKEENIDNFETLYSGRVSKSPSSAPAHSRKKKNVDFKRNTHLQFNSGSHILWRQSPNTLTRERAPSHLVPKANRFSQLRLDELKNKQYLDLNIEKNIMKTTSISFAKSSRPEHFTRQSSLCEPSPASYHLSRFMEETKYKMKSQKSHELNQLKSSCKGPTFNKFEDHHKLYVTHSKHRPYQPYNTMDNPAPGYYNHTWGSKKRDLKYTFRINLKKFNQTDNNVPGPATYRPQDCQKQQYFNTKGTTHKSVRSYLVKFDENPAPNNYQIIRFLQKK